MEVYRVECRNSVLQGEYRLYLVLAKDCGTAEAKALKKMAAEVHENKTEHYAASVELLGPLVR
jgi:hypothetical protein